MKALSSQISCLMTRFKKDEDGTQLVETAIWIGMISAAAVGAIAVLGPYVSGVYTNLRAALGL